MLAVRDRGRLGLNSRFSIGEHQVSSIEIISAILAVLEREPVLNNQDGLHLSGGFGILLKLNLSGDA